MKQLTLSLFHICLFKSKPQDLPGSREALRFTIIVTFLVFIARNWLLAGSSNAITIALAQIILLGISLWLLLKIFSKSERWIQSATALFGCSAIIIILVVIFLLATGKAVSLASENLNSLTIMILITSLWYFSIIVFILKETLEVRLWVAFWITLVLELSTALILLLIFGGSLP